MPPGTAPSAGPPPRCWSASRAASTSPAASAATRSRRGRSSSRLAPRATSGWSGRPTTTPRIRRASRGCGAESTSRRMTSSGASSAPRAARPPGRSRRSITTARLAHEDGLLDRTAARVTRSRRRTTVLIVGAVALALIGATGLAFTLTRGTTPTAALGPPHFLDETSTSGIEHTYRGDPPLEVGGGVAVIDCSGDGRPSLYLAGGAGPAALYRNDSAVGGALRFTRLPDPATDLTDVTGAYPIDIDGDGVADLVVLRRGETVILRGLGGCRFERANERWSFAPGSGLSTAFSATWEGTAALPTLALGRYLRLDPSGAATQDCADNSLFRPNAAGTGFGPPIVLAPGYCALSMLFSDWDLSGRRDLRISNDDNYFDPASGGGPLWRVAPGEPPRLYTDADGWVRGEVAGMGIASYDVTGDGYPDVFLTSQGDNRLQTLTSGPSQPTYRDIGAKRGVNAAQPFTGGDALPSTAWHPEFQDVNNDGFIDLFISKGNVGAQLDHALTDPNNLLLGQPDGTFIEAADRAGVLNTERGRGAALADFNLDGMLDLVAVSYTHIRAHETRH